MDSHLWRTQINSHDHHHHHQVDLTLRLGFSNGDGGEPLPADIDRNKPFLSSAHLNDINHHAFQTHQVIVNNHGGRNEETMMMSEANYNPQQIVWSNELKTYVLSSNYNYGQQHQVNNNNAIGSSNSNNLANLPVLQKNKNDLYTLLNPAASRISDDHEAEASSSGRRKGSRRRRVSCNDPEKRCTNYNCNTNFTPMWRKGPLGPKSLCNACGIRYRKELLNQTVAAENSHSHSHSHSHS